MKKKIISLALAVVLVFALSFSAFATGNLNRPAVAAGSNITQTGDPAQVRDLMTSVLQNRAELLTIETNNVNLAIRLRSVISDIKAGGGTVSQDTLDRLKALQDQLKGLHDQLAATRGQLDSLMAAYKQYRQNRDFENAAAVLEQIIAVQQDRISAKTSIGSLEQQMLDILGSNSTAA